MFKCFISEKKIALLTKDDLSPWSQVDEDGDIDDIALETESVKLVIKNANLKTINVFLLFIFIIIIFVRLGVAISSNLL